MRMDEDMPTDDQVRVAVDAFRMLADPTRVRVLWLLRGGERSVNALAGAVGATPTAVSQHLAKLRLSGLVRPRRDGTHAYYTLTDTHVAQLLEEALFHADHAVADLPDHPRSR
jgi:DNA-binding transcriptional ArsR family regulator